MFKACKAYRFLFVIFDTDFIQKEEKINNLQEQCKFYEMKFTQSMKRAEELPKVQQELENRKAALNAV